MIRNSSASHLTAPWLVVYNPAAKGGVLGREWPAIAARLLTMLPQLEIAASAHKGHADELVQQAAERGIRHVLAVGGDGTAHQVVNGIMRQDVVPSTAFTFALLPWGTGNDWIKTHGIPRQWAAWQQYFTQAQAVPHNVGEIILADGRKHYFINVAGLAYDAFVVDYASKKSSWLPGRLFYLWTTLRCLFQYRPQLAELEWGGRVALRERARQPAKIPPTTNTSAALRVYTINLGVGRYSGGGMQLVPQANPQADTMALTYVGYVPWWRVLLNTHRFYGGRIATFSEAVLTQVEHIQIAAGEPEGELLIEADGELLGKAPVSIQLQVGAVQVLGVG